MNSKRRDDKPTAPAAAAYTITEAGAMIGLSRNGAYDAARRGEIPVLKFGRIYRVPKALWDRKLGLTGAV
jgi:excisionase family DNA binding protein